MISDYFDVLPYTRNPLTGYFFLTARAPVCGEIPQAQPIHGRCGLRAKMRRFRADERHLEADLPGSCVTGQTRSGIFRFADAKLI